MLATDIAAVAGVERPPGVTIGFHVCRGNQSSMWMGEGDYEPIAERTFGSLPVDRFLLEYDDERAGGFAPLRFVPCGQGGRARPGRARRRGRRSRPRSCARRIDEAAKYLDLGQLALSPQCGFASIAEGGNLLTADEQYAKLALVAQVARTVWGDGERPRGRMIRVRRARGRGVDSACPPP